MKCFVVLAALAAVSTAQYHLPLNYGAGIATPYGAAIARPYAHYAGARIASPLLKAVHAPVVKAAPAPILKAAPAPILKAAPAVAVKAVPAAPLVKAAPIAAPGVHATQYHAQDEFGAYEFGYDNPTSSRREKGTAGHGVTGSYSYVDGNGLKQKVDYVADAYGFRTVGTNFPNTAATSAIKSPYYAPYAHRVFKRQAILPAATAPLAVGTPLAYNTHIAAPLAYNAPVAYAGHAAVVHSAPAAREADLLRIQLNPGHAVAYRVY